MSNLNNKVNTKIKNRAINLIIDDLVLYIEFFNFENSFMELVKKYNEDLKSNETTIMKTIEMNSVSIDDWTLRFKQLASNEELGSVVSSLAYMVFWTNVRSRMSDFDVERVIKSAIAKAKEDYEEAKLKKFPAYRFKDSGEYGLFLGFKENKLWYGNKDGKVVSVDNNFNVNHSYDNNSIKSLERFFLGLNTDVSANTITDDIDVKQKMVEELTKHDSPMTATELKDSEIALDKYIALIKVNRDATIISLGEELGIKVN